MNVNKVFLIYQNLSLRSCMSNGKKVRKKGFKITFLHLLRHEKIVYDRVTDDKFYDYHVKREDSCHRIAT